MQRLRAYVSMGVALVAALGAPAAHAVQWAQFAVVSPTATMSAGHICYTDGLGIACDATAPLMSGIGSGYADRITSGTSSVFVANGSAVSVTIAGSNVANFGTGGLGITAINASGLIQSTGISNTGAISTTGTGYFGGNVGIGMIPTSANLSVSGSVDQSVRISTGTNYRAIELTSPGSFYPIEFYNTTGPTNGKYFRFAWNSTGLSFEFPNDAYSATIKPITIVATTGNVGINTTTPAATLQVSGTFIVSQTGQNTTPSVYVGSNGYMGLGTSAPSGTLHIFNPNSSSIVIARSANPTLQGIIDYSSSGMYMGTVGSAAFSLRTNNLTRLTIDTSGNTGIGATSPQTKLEVGGTISASQINVSGTVSATAVYSSGVMKMGKYSSQPVACSSTYDGMIALTSQYTICACKGGSTSWVKTSDGTTACSW